MSSSTSSKPQSTIGIIGASSSPPPMSTRDTVENKRLKLQIELQKAQLLLTKMSVSPSTIKTGGVLLSTDQFQKTNPEKIRTIQRNIERLKKDIIRLTLAIQKKKKSPIIKTIQKKTQKKLKTMVKRIINVKGK